MNAGQLLERVYQDISDIVRGVATGGSATTIVDTTINGKFQTAKFKDWLAIITKTTDGLSPQSRYGLISASTTAGTITMESVTDAVAAGDSYALCNSKGSVPHLELLSLVNRALRRLDMLSLWDRSLTTASATLRYTLPIATKQRQFRELHLEDSDYQRYEAPNYYIENAAGGTQATLVFHSQPLESKTIVFNYMGYHPELTAYNSTINETIHDELAVAIGVERAMWWKMMPKRKSIDEKNWALAKQMLAEMLALHPIERPIVENQHVPINMFNE